MLENNNAPSEKIWAMLVPKILISLHEKSITSVSTSPTSVKMYSLKGICLLIVIFANLANCQNDDSSDDYEYSGDDYEYPDDYEDECDKPCDFYDDAKCAKECHHDNFRDVTPLKELFGDNVKTCCSGHQYYFIDSCEVWFNYFNSS